MKKLVFNYLDILFRDSKIIIREKTNLFKIVDEKGNSICSTSIDRNGNLSIHFSHSEYYLIINMFGLNYWDALDYVEEYISNKFSSLMIGVKLPVPFHPYL